MFLYKSKSGLSMGGSAERRTVAEMEKLVNKSGSTQDLLNYLDEDVPGYSNYRNLYVIGLFTMAIFALPSNIAVMILLYKKLFWKSNVLLLLFQAVIFHTETAPFQADFKQCVTHGAYTEQWQELAYSLTTVIIMFFLPVLVMALCYISIFMRITKEARQASETGEYLSQHSTVRKELYSRVRRATLWMTVVFVLCFIVCWGKCRSESHIMP
ncbi:hypothetical protein RvY_13521-4 [Ramazzottius varieornatus]|uniref:G-protein coupled receptors family 1 profile domain-containing protein n=1 Tax=Ramazzottius varieornatus TaxID=947166 RepID=A0A1D1VQC1_RAMVA|nr:hypothetical protein RvY_13521-4 [Ramazzottius varieornatus]